MCFYQRSSCGKLDKTRKFKEIKRNEYIEALGRLREEKCRATIKENKKLSPTECARLYGPRSYELHFLDWSSASSSSSSFSLSLCSRLEFPAIKVLADGRGTRKGEACAEI